MTKKTVEKIAQKLGWSVDWDDDKSVTFSQYSPAGQDFSFSVDYKKIDDIYDEVFLYYQNYDPSYEAYLWLDESGHGKNGAPYGMGDVYNDMVACEEMLSKLEQALNEARSSK